MSLLKIAQLGHPVLRERAREVLPDELRSPAFQRLIDDMIETKRDANGAGIAANQVYDTRRVFLVENENNPRYPYKPNFPLTVLINPQVTPLSDVRFQNFEGCLSVPNLRGRVERFAEVRVRGLDRDGEPVDFELRGLTAGTFQHELDHLDGVLFVDRLVDSKSLCTVEHFERYEKAAFAEEANRLVERYGN